MNLEIGNLTVTDPLAEQEVTIVIRVRPDNVQRPARTALVSVGTGGQPPMFVSGVLEDVADLIHQAWLAYGVRTDLQQNSAEDSATVDMETVAEAIIDEEDGQDETPPAAPMQLQPSVPRAQARLRPQNLSLF
jgi:hypothetical protein